MNRKNINRKTVSFSITYQVHVIKPCDLNGGGRLFGGALLSMLDEIAGIVAKRHSGCNNVTTAAIDHLDFKDGAYVNDLLVIIGYVTYTGNTSMEVRIDTYVENNEGMRHPINRAFFVMVAMGANNRPTKVPPLIHWKFAYIMPVNRAFVMAGTGAGRRQQNSSLIIEK